MPTRRPQFMRLCKLLGLATVLNVPGGAYAIKFLEGCTGYGCFAIFFAACLYATWLASYLLYFLLLLPPFRNGYLRAAVLTLPAFVSLAVLIVTWEELRWSDEFSTTLLLMLAPNLVVPFVAWITSSSWAKSN